MYREAFGLNVTPLPIPPKNKTKQNTKQAEKDQLNKQTKTPQEFVPN